MDDVSVDSTTLAGDPFAAAGQRHAQEELLEAAEAALAWLYDRRAHVPEEMLDPREHKHRKRLFAAIREARRTAS